MIKNKLLILGGVLLLASALIGCSEDDSALTSIDPMTKEIWWHAHIYVFAEGHPYYMPFSGEAVLWAFDNPVEDPTEYKPVDHIWWNEDDENPWIVWELPGGKYLYWMGWQNVQPPNENWQTYTRIYSGYASGEEDYIDDCEFFAE